MPYTRPIGKICWQLHLKHHNDSQNEAMEGKEREGNIGTKESREEECWHLEQQTYRKRVRMQEKERKMRNN